MANNPAAPLPYLEVANYLETQGVAGGATGWKLVRGTMPATPGQVLAVFPAGGPQPEGKYELSHPNVQLRVRGDRDEQTPALLKLQEAVTALRTVKGAVLGTGRYVHLIPVSEPLPLGEDNDGRFEYTITLRAAREPAP